MYPIDSLVNKQSTGTLPRNVEGKDEIVKILLIEYPEISEEKINTAIDRCSLIIPKPRHRTAFLQTIKWYLTSIHASTK